MNTSAKRILLVDDDEVLVNTFESILQKEGYFVESATTGQDALERAKKTKFQLVILDIKLPDLMGGEVASLLRKQDDEIGIIFITGFPTFQKCIDTLDLGIHEILLKPIPPNELLRATREAFFTRREKYRARAIHDPSGRNT